MNDTLEIRDLSDFANGLKRLREGRKLTQTDTARLAGISRQRLSNLESGKASNVELLTLLRLLEAFGLTLRAEPDLPRPTLSQIFRERAREQALT